MEVCTMWRCVLYGSLFYVEVCTDWRYTMWICVCVLSGGVLWEVWATRCVLCMLC